MNIPKQMDENLKNELAPVDGYLLLCSACWTVDRIAAEASKQKVLLS